MSAKWYEKSGNQADTAISTRIRLARNLKEYPFPCRLPVEQRLEVCKKITDALQGSNSVLSSGYDLIDMSKLSDLEAVSLVESHLVSPDFISQKEGRFLIKTNDDNISIMINEEDHLRIQIIKEGFDLDEAYDLADKVDTLLDNELDFAYSEKLGYLTQCPTNLGTGMRASIMLHLPALQASGAINRLVGNLSKLGLTIRGTFGEGSEAKGALYQLSNQITLGISEQAAIENLKSITQELMNQERAARENMKKNIETADTIHRSLGILKYARTISTDEALKLLSNIRLGVETEEIKDIEYEKINYLMIAVQPGLLTQNSGKQLTSAQRDSMRADMLRKSFETS